MKKTLIALLALTFTSTQTKSVEPSVKSVESSDSFKHLKSHTIIDLISRIEKDTPVPDGVYKQLVRDFGYDEIFRAADELLSLKKNPVLFNHYFNSEDNFKASSFEYIPNISSDRYALNILNYQSIQNFIDLIHGMKASIEQEAEVALVEEQYAEALRQSEQEYLDAQKKEELAKENIIKLQEEKKQIENQVQKEKEEAAKKLEEKLAEEQSEELKKSLEAAAQKAETEREEAAEKDRKDREEVLKQAEKDKALAEKATIAAKSKYEVNGFTGGAAHVLNNLKKPPEQKYDAPIPNQKTAPTTPNLKKLENKPQPTSPTGMIEQLNGEIAVLKQQLGTAEKKDIGTIKNQIIQKQVQVEDLIDDMKQKK